MKLMIKSRGVAWLFAYLYGVSYVMRINFSVIIQPMILETGFEKSDLSIILVGFFMSYGIGQIVNGYIGDKIKPQNLILLGLSIASLTNIIFPFCSSSIVIMCVLWTINGFAQAMLWPPMVKIMVSMMDEIAYNSAVVIVSLGSSIGTILVYLTAPALIHLFSWKGVMLLSAIIGFFSSVLWFALKNHCYGKTKALQEGAVILPQDKKPFQLPKHSICPFVLIAIGIVIQGMIRDGVSSWMPTYLFESFGIGEEKSILLTVSLAFVSMISFVVAGVFYKRFFKNEVLCATVFYTFACICCGALFFLFDFLVAGFAVFMMALISGAMHGVNLMLISHVPKRFRKFGNISTISGLVNSFTYVGSAIATYGIARLSEIYGWKATVGFWFAVLIVGTLVCLIAVSAWRNFIEKNEKTGFN